MIDTEGSICSRRIKCADSVRSYRICMTKLGQAVQNLWKTALLSTEPDRCAQRRSAFETRRTAKPRILILLSKRFTTQVDSATAGGEGSLIRVYVFQPRVDLEEKSSTGFERRTGVASSTRRRLVALGSRGLRSILVARLPLSWG